MKTFIRAKNFLKSQLIEFFSEEYDFTNMKATEIYKIVDKIIEQDDNIRLALITKYNEPRLGIAPFDLELALQCKPTERKRWQEKGIFTIVNNKTTNKYGYESSFPIFDRLQVEHMTYAEVEGLRYVHEYLKKCKKKFTKNEVESKRKESLAKTKQTKKEFLERQNIILQQWANDEEYKYVLDLVYWICFTESLYKMYKDKCLFSISTSSKTYQNAKAQIETLEEEMKQAVNLLINNKHVSFIRYKNGMFFDKIVLSVNYKNIQMTCYVDEEFSYQETINERIRNGIYINEKNIIEENYTLSQIKKGLHTAMQNYKLSKI